jgi:hypothetical protein
MKWKSDEIGNLFNKKIFIAKSGSVIINKNLNFSIYNIFLEFILIKNNNN